MLTSPSTLLQSNPDFWATWNSFEIETGSEDTFREVSLPSPPLSLPFPPSPLC